MYLTVVSVDASLSKQFTIGGTMVLTPYLGGQALFILGDSTVIDGTPTRSSYAECPQRQVQFTRDADGRVTGSDLVCIGGGGTPMGVINDSHNEMVFEPARILRWRGFGGLRFRYGIFTVTAEFGMDLVDPGFLSTPGRGLGRPAANGTRQDIRLDAFQQWTTSFGAGVQFN
jgi:hypothetical protein